MMELSTFKEIAVEIPHIGACILLPVNQLPENIRYYKKILLTANTGGFTELPRMLSVNAIHRIFKAVTLKLAEEGVKETESVTVILSGLHTAYTYIDATEKDQEMTMCLTALKLFFWQNAKLSPSGKLIQGRVVMQTNEITSSSFIDIPEGDSVYCLFLEQKVR